MEESPRALELGDNLGRTAQSFWALGEVALFFEPQLSSPAIKGRKLFLPLKVLWGRMRAAMWKALCFLVPGAQPPGESPRNERALCAKGRGCILMVAKGTGTHWCVGRRHSWSQAAIAKHLSYFISLISQPPYSSNNFSPLSRGKTCVTKFSGSDRVKVRMSESERVGVGEREWGCVCSWICTSMQISANIVWGQCTVTNQNPS